MPVSFSELVVEGQFVLVKGFLMGFLYGREKPFKYFFHRKYGIRRETFGEFLKEIFELDSYTHLCLEDAVVPQFMAAIEKSKDKIGLNIKSVRNIQSAAFTFSYEVFNDEMAKNIKAIFEKTFNGVQIENYNPREERADDAVGIEGYAPVHSFVASGSGKVTGDFNGVMDIFLEIKRSEFAESIMCSKITLQLADREKSLID